MVSIRVMVRDKTTMFAIVPLKLHMSRGRESTKCVVLLQDAM